MKWFDKLFRKTRSVVQLMGGGMAGDFRTEAYKNSVVRETVDAIARHGAKLKGQHVRGKSGGSGIEIMHGHIEYMLQFRPNPWMSAYDFLYKLITQTMLKNNGFALISWDGSKPYVLPIDYTSCTAMQDEQTQLVFVQFMLIDGRQLTVPYDDLIHLRRHFNSKKIMGDDNEPLIDAIELVNVAKTGMASAIKTGTTLRGILTATNKILDWEELTKNRDKFVKEYGDPVESGGVAALDGTLKYEQLDASKMYRIDPEQQLEIRNGIYRYFGTHEAIVSGNFKEDQWNAFYESLLEPIAIQLSLEFTEKLFTERERGFGNQIVFEANRLQYASATTKINLLAQAAPLSLLTIDEGRDILNLPPVEGGDKRLQSLNFVNANQVDQYQLGTKKAENEGDENA